MKLERKYLVLCTIAGFVVAFDQLVKIYIHTNFALGDSLPVIQDFFNITYVRNTGAAFGIGSNANELLRSMIFLTLPPLAMIIILSMMTSVEESDRWQVFSLSLIFGGALGNYIDRLRFGYVIDFLDFHYKGIWSYPAFNIADSAIVGGVTILIAIILNRWWAEQKALKSKPKA